MNLAIMQPYIFPYIGYFQLMNAVDKFVLYDNVQFIKDGWINRNRLLINKQASVFTLPLKKDSYTARINERFLSPDRWAKERRKIVMQIEQNYRKSPFFEEAYPIINECLMNECEDLFSFIRHSICQVKNYLNIECELSVASDLDVDHTMTGQEKVLAICKKLNAAQYINVIAGRELYSKEEFHKSNIEFLFIRSKNVTYPQYDNDFVPWLSIIDLMMFNSADQIQEYLTMCELV